MSIDFFKKHNAIEYLIDYYERKKVKSLNRVRLFVTPWTVAYQASPSMGFSRQEYWSGLPFPSPKDLPNSGLPNCRQTLYHLRLGNPNRLLQSVNITFIWAGKTKNSEITHLTFSLCASLDLK